MRSLDLAPLFRSSVGFDNLTRVLDSVSKFEDTRVSYPPYNIVKESEDGYRITFAVAGFGKDNINIVVENNTLTVKGKLVLEKNKAAYLHRGIAGRSFERSFQLADHVQVADATMENGLLHVTLRREVPEALKPRSITITSGHNAKKIKQKAA